MTALSVAAAAAGPPPEAAATAAAGFGAVGMEKAQVAGFSTPRVASASRVTRAIPLLPWSPPPQRPPGESSGGGLPGPAGTCPVCIPRQGRQKHVRISVLYKARRD